MNFTTKLPNVGTTIFTVMSALAQEHGAINLSQGFPDFDCPEELKSLVAKHMRLGHNQYAPMAGLPALREVLAAKIRRMYGRQADPQTEITITAGATQALFTAFAAFVQPGDEVILIEPAYDSYRPAVELFGGVSVPYLLHYPDYRVDWDAMEIIISPRTRMIVVNTPHNPTGKVFREADLLKLEQLAEKHDLLVVSDEVYEHLVFDGRSHQSALRFPELYRRTLATFSFGKTFHNTGWKVGYCVAPPSLTAEFRKVHQYNVFSVNTPVQYALADYLQDPGSYEGLGLFYQEKRDLFRQILEQTRFSPVVSEGTYFQLAGYQAISEEADTEFAKRMTAEFGVAVIPVSAFFSGGQDEKVVRFCFAKKRETLEKAGERLEKV